MIASSPVSTRRLSHSPSRPPSPPLPPPPHSSVCCPADSPHSSSFLLLLPVPFPRSIPPVPRPIPLPVSHSSRAPFPLSPALFPRIPSDATAPSEPTHSAPVPECCRYAVGLLSGVVGWSGSWGGRAVCTRHGRATPILILTLTRVIVDGVLAVVNGCVMGDGALPRRLPFVGLLSGRRLLPVQSEWPVCRLLSAVPAAPFLFSSFANCTC